MDKRWMQWCAIGLVLAVGCGNAATPANDPDHEGGLAGSAGEGVAGSGGSTSGGAPEAGVGGTSGAGGTASVTECDPKAPDAMAPFTMIDGGVVDGSTVEQASDAGPTDDPMVVETDAGDEATPDADVVEPVLDAGVTEPTGPRVPNAGDVVVTELMMDPTALSDSLGEWIELHNPTMSDLTLDGCVISDDGSDDFVLGASALRAGEYLVLGRSDQAAPRVDYVYSGMTLTNTSDEVVITCNGVEIDRVAYGAGYPRPAGRTMQLDAAMLSSTTNDLGTAWCAGTSAGTPGGANTVCASE